MENEEGAKFCQSCGGNLGSDTPPSEEAAPPLSKAEDTPPPPPPPPSGSVPPPPPPRPAAPRSAGSTEIDWGWIGNAFTEVFSDVGGYILLGLVVSVVSSVTLGILAGPLVGGALYIVRRKLRGQGSLNIGETFNIGFAKFGPTFLLVFISIIVVAVVGGVLQMVPVLGQIVAVVLGAFISPFLVIGLHFIMEDNLEFMDAGKKAWEVMSGNILMIMVFGLVVGLSLGSFPALELSRVV